MLRYTCILIIAGMMVEGVQSALHKKKDADLICHACLKTMEKIDKTFDVESYLHKKKKTKARKAAVNEILAAVCNNDDFKSSIVSGSKPHRLFVFQKPSKASKRKLDEETDSKEEEAKPSSNKDEQDPESAETDKKDEDAKEESAKADKEESAEGESKDVEEDDEDDEDDEEEIKETEAGAELRQICEKVVADFKDKMRPHLSDFRRRSRSNLSRDVCYKWAKMCKVPKERPILKQKLTKTDKCLIAALDAVKKQKWNLALSKLKCAQGPDPEPKKEKKKEEKEDKGEGKDDAKSDGGDNETKKNETEKETEKSDKKEATKEEEKKVNEDEMENIRRKMQDKMNEGSKKGGSKKGKAKKERAKKKDRSKKQRTKKEKTKKEKTKPKKEKQRKKKSKKGKK